MNSVDKVGNQSREAQFLQKRHDRASAQKSNRDLKYGDDQTTILNSNDNRSIQKQRLEFWLEFKRLVKDLHSRLAMLQGKPEETIDTQERFCQDDHIHKSSKDQELLKVDCKNIPSLSLDLMYVTVQQRNEANSKLLQIQLSIRALSSYTLLSKINCVTSQKQEVPPLLPEYFIKESMPELPVTDSRLLNEEIKSLKEQLEVVQNIIFPTEKFRFHRYHALRQKQDCLIGNALDNLGKENKYDRSDLGNKKHQLGQNPKVVVPHTFQHKFDGLRLIDKKNCGINVEMDGTINIKTSSTSVSTKSHLSSIKKNNVKGASFLIHGLDNCNVTLNGIHKSVHITDMNESVLRITQPIFGPVHVTNCHNTCISFAFSRQLRIHDCSSLKFNLHVASGPIIESCQDIKFYQQDCIGNGNDIACENVLGPNLYGNVKDFNWLKNSVKSPNFQTIPQVNVVQSGDKPHDEERSEKVINCEINESSDEDEL